MVLHLLTIVIDLYSYWNGYYFSTTINIILLKIITKVIFIYLGRYLIHYKKNRLNILAFSLTIPFL